MPFTKNMPRLLTAASVVFAVLVTAYLIRTYAVNAPYSDDWAIVSLFQHYHDHTLSFSSFFAQHNEHRILFPRLAILSLAILTHWNQLAEIWVSFSLSVLAFLVLCRSMVESLGAKSKYLLTVLAVTPWVYFSPIQWENWLWGWQIEWSLMQLGVVLATYLLVTHKDLYANYWSNLITAIVAAIVATYSVSNGMLIWPIGLTILLIQHRNFRATITWATAGLIACGAYFVGYKSQTSGAIILVLHRPFDFLQYFLVTVGRPLGSDISSSSQYGAFLLLTFCLWAGYAFVSGTDFIKRATYWLALGVFCLASLIFVSIGRFNYGVNQAMSSRYTLLSGLFLVAVIVLTALMFSTKSKILPASSTGTVTFAVISTFVLSIVVNNYFYGVTSMQNQRATQKLVAACLQQVKSANDTCLKLTNHNSSPEATWSDIQTLRVMGWGNTGPVTPPNSQ